MFTLSAFEENLKAMFFYRFYHFASKCSMSFVHELRLESALNFDKTFEKGYKTFQRKAVYFMHAGVAGITVEQTELLR